MLARTSRTGDLCYCEAADIVSYLCSHRTAPYLCAVGFARRQHAILGSKTAQQGAGFEASWNFTCGAVELVELVGAVELVELESTVVIPMKKSFGPR